MLNHVVIMGRLTRNPELRKTGNDISVVSVSLAVERDFKPKDDSPREVDFVDVVAWRGTADFLAKYFTKGRMAVVSGRLQVRKWKDRDGNDRRSTEVLAESVYFADSKKSESQPPQCESGVQADGDFPF